jgi:murein DD-endopeptidase MepM/ murein hydrolase activator NlpD
MLPPMRAAVLLTIVLAAASSAPRAAEGEAPGTGARIVLAPTVARPGDVVLVRARTPAVAGTLAGHPISFFAHGDETWALGALPIETPAGVVQAEIFERDVARPHSSATLTVVEPGFPSKRLSVAPKFVTPPASVKERIKRDQAAFAAAYRQPFVPPLFAASFAWPHPGAHHGRYGDQRVFNGKKESVHYGLDIDAPRGAPVRAANDGEVVLARDCYYSGKTVVVWHGADLFTLYFHMDRLDVKPGARVRQGDRLGIVGSTGRSTGPHLHWSAKAAGLLVDPESLMGIDFALGTALPRRAGPPPHAPEEEAPAAEPPPEASGTTATAAPPR